MGRAIHFGALKQPSDMQVTPPSPREAAIYITEARSNTFSWSGRGIGQDGEFPEVDRIGWFPVAQARPGANQGAAGVPRSIRPWRTPRWRD